VLHGGDQEMHLIVSNFDFAHGHLWRFMLYTETWGAGVAQSL